MQQLPSDLSLIQDIQKGDRESFAIFFRRYYAKLLQYGRRWTADEGLIEECIQDLFLYLFEHSESLKLIRQPKTYLYVSLRRRLLASAKKNQRLKQREQGRQENMWQFSVEDFIIRKEEEAEQAELIQELLNQLPTRQREVIYLKYYDNLSTKEIAEVMNISDQGVLNMIYKAFKKLRTTESLSLILRLTVLSFPFFL